MATREEIYNAIRKADAAGDEASVRALAQHLSSMDAPAQPQAQEKPARGVMEELGRQLGLTVRHGLEGGAQLLEIGSEPIRAGLEAVGVPKMMPAGQLASSAADAIGLPKPETATERVVGDASRLVAGSMGMTGAAAKAGLVPLAAAPGAQALSAAGAGTAGGAAREGGGGPGAQFAASLAGGLAAPLAASRVIAPNTSPEVLALMKEGVTPTPGQVLGGTAKRVENAATSIPIVGDVIKAGQRRAVGDLNRAAANRALAPFGEKLPDGMQGREAVGYIKDRLGERYDELLNGITVAADLPFLQKVRDVQRMAGTGGMDPAAVQRLDTILKNRVLGKFIGPGAKVTGETMKQIESDLGQMSASFRRDTSSDMRNLGDALMEVQSQLRHLVGRSNPAIAPELRKVNEGYANYKRLERAAASLGSDEGVFSPAQLLSAVKATDRSKDKAKFARGDALMQDLADSGRTVLGNNVPDSGTPLRAMVAGGTLGVGGAVSPTVAPATLAALAYTPAGQRAMAALLAKRPDVIRDLQAQGGGQLLPLSSLALPAPLFATELTQ